MMKIDYLRKIAVICLTVCWLGVVSCDTRDTIDPAFEDFFIKYFGNEGDQTGKGLVVTTDGIVMAGTTSIDDALEIYLVKTDFDGNLLWDRRYEQSDMMKTVGMVQDQAGNLYIAANREVAEDEHDIYVLKTDPSGGVIQEATFRAENDLDDDYDDQVASITINASNQVLLTGWTADVGDPDLPSNISDVFSLLLSPALVPLPELEWRKVSGFRESMDLGRKIVQARAGGRYFFIGTTDKADGTGLTAQTNLISFPLANDGQFPVGDVINGTTNTETAADIIPTSGGDVVAMWNSSTGFNASTIYLAYANEEQDYQLQSGVPMPFNTVVGKSIIQSRFGGFIILAEQINNNNTDIFLVRTDQNFNIIWQKALGGLENEEASQVAELEDGSIVLTGTVVLESQSKLFLIKTKANGDLKR